MRFLPVTETLRPGDRITVVATSTSGLPVTLNLNSGPGILSENILTVKPFASKTGKARIIIRAGQVGNEEFATAKPVEMIVEVKK